MSLHIPIIPILIKDPYVEQHPTFQLHNYLNRLMADLESYAAMLHRRDVDCMKRMHVTQRIHSQTSVVNQIYSPGYPFPPRPTQVYRRHSIPTLAQNYMPMSMSSSRVTTTAGNDANSTFPEGQLFDIMTTEVKTETSADTTDVDTKTEPIDDIIVEEIKE